MALREYRRRRNFARTPEPRGGRRAHRSRAPSFVVQKHAARNLHYDFRLEHEGVLWSWAVPKGPSLDPRVKRLAMRTEDHPLEYGDFEGVIPKGEYGGGTVLVWDRGSWSAEGDPKKALDGGHLDFTLHGEKLRGRWHLVKTRARQKDKRGNAWLLFKGSDDEARPGAARELVEQQPDSVITGKDLAEVSGAAERVWHSNRSQPRLGRDVLPEFVEPQLATLVTAAPAGEEWLSELKLDGYRIQARIEKEQVELRSRNALTWTARFPSIARALRMLPARKALLDGEVVVLRDGKSDFQELQNALSRRDDARCVYFVFDLLHLDGHDLRARPLVERKELLRALLKGADDRTRYSDHLAGNGPEFFRAACELGAEGAVCKLANAPYASGRSRAWLKVKCKARQEFVIGGFSAPAGSRSHFGALLLGVQEDGALRYAGKVGTGFTAQSLSDLSGKLANLSQKACPFEPALRGAEARDVRWVKPELVAEIEFAERTRDGRVRHASFLGLREDKSPMQVKRERPASPRRVTKQAPKDAPKLALTHPDRVLYPEAQLTKRDLALYLTEVAPVMLPHVAGRPLTLFRCPEGRQKECFFQKHPGRGTPEAIHGVSVRESGGMKEYMTVADVDGLVGLAQLGALEIHAWGSRAPDVEHPDQVTFDLDPDPTVPWKDVVSAARDLRAQLEKLGLESFVKTTGGKGLHVVVPITPRGDFDEVKEFARALCEERVAAHPDRYLAKASKAARKGKIFLDYLRNAHGATAVVPYSTRARENAPVATPLSWTELSARLDPQRFTLRTVPKRLAKLGRDPWEAYTKVRQSLPALR